MESTSEATVLEQAEESLRCWRGTCPQAKCGAPLLVSMDQLKLEDWKNSLACWRCGARYDVQIRAGRCEMQPAPAKLDSSSNGDARDGSALSPSGDGILIKAIEDATEPLFSQIIAIKKQLDAVAATLAGDRKNRPPELSAAAPGPSMAASTRLETDLADMAEAVKRIEKAIKATTAKGGADVQSSSDLLREIITVQTTLAEANLDQTSQTLKLLDGITSGTSKDVKAIQSRLRGSSDKTLIAEIKLMLAEYFQGTQSQGKPILGVLARLNRLEHLLNALAKARPGAVPSQPVANAEADGQSPDEVPPIALAPATVQALVAQLAAHRFAELNGQREKIPEDVPALIDKVELQLHSWRHAERPELPKEAREAVVAVLEDVVDSIRYWLEAHGIQRYGAPKDSYRYDEYSLDSTVPTSDPELVDKVKDVVFSGYRWQESGKLLRAAKVIVWSKAPDA